MEFFYFIPAIIVLIYWIVENPIKNIFHLKYASNAVSGDLHNNVTGINSKTNTVPVISLTQKVKAALDSDKLNYVMDEKEGLAWVLLADDDQYFDDRDIFILIQPDVNTITYRIGIINDLSDEDIIPITELCNRLNDRITYGRFVFDYADASVRLIIYYHLLTDSFSRKRHQAYFGALLQYKLEVDQCFVNVKLKKELPIVAVMGK